jgi:hypothetical protein
MGKLVKDDILQFGGSNYVLTVAVNRAVMHVAPCRLVVTDVSEVCAFSIIRIE